MEVLDEMAYMNFALNTTSFLHYKSYFFYTSITEIEKRFDRTIFFKTQVSLWRRTTLMYTSDW